MNKTVSRVLWIVAGVLLIVAGGACMLLSLIHISNV